VRARAVLVVLDGLPHRHVGPRVTPTLDRLCREGGWAREGGVGVLTSATYPNHATLVTGARPEVHGLTANFVAREGTVTAAADLGPAVDTVFTAAATAGLRSAAVFGDQHLVGVTGARAATAHWPVGGDVPADAVRTSDGYIADVSTVRALLDALEADPDLVVTQLNDPDTAGHAVGPDSDEAAETYHRTDRQLAAIVDALATRWDHTVLAVVSDHDQVPVTVVDSVDLWSPARAAGLELTIIPEGQAAVISGDDPTGGGWLDRVDGIVGHEPWYAGTRLAWTEPGRAIGWGECTMQGIHGGPAARTQVAVVAGGHPAVRAVAAALDAGRPRAEDWAPTLAAVLGLTLPAAQGRSLAGS
jgi:predicted AlkP superfamily pyrophosphatase or phosphodiesterase